ncbi:MAG: FkbM family methyltransferase [Chlamydiales bacterium]|nr:FkbM family methyltransferase [Chlamydiales bacterium]
MNKTDIKAIQKVEHLLNQYRSGMIEKFIYLDQIHEFNEILFFYAKQITDQSIIKKLEMENGKIIFTTKQNVRFSCNDVDRRGTLFMALNLGFYEEEENLIYSIISKNNVCFDIGTNIGWFSLHLAQKKPGIQIHAFEPLPAVFNNFKKNLNLNNFEGIHPYKLGFSNKEDVLDLHFSPSLTALSSIKQLFPEQTSKIKCKFITLDSFVEANHIQNIDLLKIDVEGAELLVIEGAKNTLHQFNPVLFLEIYEGWTSYYEYTPDDLIQKLADFDYECFIYNQKKLLKVDMYEEGKCLGKYNFFFLNRSKHSNWLQYYS